MAKYVFVYHGGGAPESEEEGAAVMQAWNDWFASLGSAVVDVGQSDRGHQPRSVPMAPTSQGGGANPVTGYSIDQRRQPRRCPRPRQGLSPVGVRWDHRGRRDHRDVAAIGCGPDRTGPRHRSHW